MARHGSETYFLVGEGVLGRIARRQNCVAASAHRSPDRPSTIFAPSTTVLVRRSPSFGGLAVALEAVTAFDRCAAHVNSGTFAVAESRDRRPDN